MESTNKQYLRIMINKFRNPGEDNKTLVVRISSSPDLISIICEMLPELHGPSVISIITNPEFYMSL